MTFDDWWAGYWQPTQQPAIFDATLRGLALASWNAAIASAAVLPPDAGHTPHDAAQSGEQA